MAEQAIGMIETQGLVPALAAADAAAKAANVKITRRVHIKGSPLTTVLYEGDVASVTAAMEVGAAEARRVGTLVSVNVIARSAAGLESVTGGGPKPPAAPKKSRRTSDSSAGDGQSTGG